MTVDDGEADPTLGAVARLSAYDVSQRHTRRLRRRCHAVLQPPGQERSVPRLDGRALQRVVAPALGGAWCLVYLVEIMRRAAGLYFSTP
jgi:hypothetical protein